jgi:oxygen-independent coproporphyrinogen-3 oxidase
MKEKTTHTLENKIRIRELEKNMIYLVQNKKEYDYDIRAILLAFFEREKIVDVTEKEPGMENPRFLIAFDFGEGIIHGKIEEDGILKTERRVACDYEDHGPGRRVVDKFIYQLISDYTGRTLPWGTLTGIRPTKIIFQWLLEGLSDEEAQNRFCDAYLATKQKARVCTQVAKKEQEVLGRITYEDEYSIYIGIPFCPTTCLYCSFTSFPLAKFSDRVENYLKALYKEMAYVAEAYRERKLTTVYIGGGTPTSLTAPQMDELLTKVEETFDLSYVREFTVEAGRPDSITPRKLQVLKDHKVSRISINPQTMNQETLDLIGRRHTVEQTKEAFHLARSMGFDNINMDLIVGLPGEGIAQVEHTMEEIEALDPDDITVHALALKRAARLALHMDEYEKISFRVSDEIMQRCEQGCSALGMTPYYLYRQKNMAGNFENVGYAKPGKAGLYNILIMEEVQCILACGASGSTKIVYEDGRIERIENVKDIRSYLNRIDEMISRKDVLRG